MRKLSNYKVFLEKNRIEMEKAKALNESVDDVRRFANDLESAAESAGFDSSFNFMMTSNNYRNMNPRQVFTDMMNHMRLRGWSSGDIEDLFDDYYDDILRSSAASSNGGCDYFLYKFTNGRFPLSGNVLEEYVNGYNEHFIKYKYGYHETDYGKIYLSQAYNRWEDFLNDLAENLLFYVLEGEDSNLSYNYRIPTKGESFHNELREKLINNGALEINGNEVTIHMNVLIPELDFIDTKDDNFTESFVDEIRMVTSWSTGSLDIDGDKLVVKL